MLGLPRASTEAQVKEAYFQLARRFHPDTHHDPAMDDLGEKLEAVFIRLGQAYEVLRNPRTRASYEADLAARAPRGPRVSEPAATTSSSPSPAAAPAPPAPPAPSAAAGRAQEARRAFDALVAAEKHIEGEKYWDAIQLLEYAVQWLDGKPLARARTALGRSYAKNPNWSKQAETSLKAALQVDPKNVEAHVLLGGLYAGQGLRSRAAKSYRRALDLQPDRHDAAEALAALGPDETDAPPEERGGILKKLFGKR